MKTVSNEEIRESEEQILEIKKEVEKVKKGIKKTKINPNDYLVYNTAKMRQIARDMHEALKRYDVISNTVSSISSDLHKAKQYIGILTSGTIIMGTFFLMFVRPEHFGLLLFPMIGGMITTVLLYINVIRIGEHAKRSQEDRQSSD